MFKRSEWVLQYKHTTLWRQSSQCSVNTCTETSQCHRKVFKEIITCSYIFINLKCKVLLGLNSRTLTDLFYIDGLNKQSQWKYQKNKYSLGYAEFSQTAVILCCLQQSSVKSTPSLQFQVTLSAGNKYLCSIGGNHFAVLLYIQNRKISTILQ